MNYPDKCPLTGSPFFMELETPAGDVVPTYGGPFDSYTIPVKDEGDNPDGTYTVQRYDHDEGAWVEDETIYEEDISADQLSAYNEYLKTRPVKRKCHYCELDAVDVIDTDINFGCEKHKARAKAATIRNSNYINKHGFDKWLKLDSSRTK